MLWLPYLWPESTVLVVFSQPDGAGRGPAPLSSPGVEKVEALDHWRRDVFEG
jgi:hypothetical protein